MALPRFKPLKLNEPGRSRSKLRGDITAPAALMGAGGFLRIHALRFHYAILTGNAVRWWRWYGVAGYGAPHFHFRHFLFSLNHAPTAPAEKVAGHAGSAQDRRQGHHQRRPARHDHGAQRRFSASARSSK